MNETDVRDMSKKNTFWTVVTFAAFAATVSTVFLPGNILFAIPCGVHVYLVKYNSQYNGLGLLNGAVALHIICAIAAFLGIFF